MITFFLLVGLAFLLVGGTFLVRGASTIASHYGISPLVVGLTVVAFGTSAPELVVNVVGAVRNETELAFGNVAGSNLANLGLVLGMAALVRPLTIEGQIVRRELPLLLLGSTILVVMMLDVSLQGTPAILSRADAIILLLLFSIFVYITVSDYLSSKEDALVRDVNAMETLVPVPETQNISVEWLYIAGGIVGLSLGGHLTIVNGAALAESLGVSPVVIGLLVVAVGTSMPEMVTSVIAAMRRECDLCVGNIVGSNLFNSLIVLPISALVRPLPIPEGGLADIVVSLVFAAVIVPIFFLRKGELGRLMGFGLLLVYVGYMWQRTLNA